MLPTIDELHETASTAAGLSDFGPDDYRDGLAALLGSYATDAALTPRGEMTVAASLRDVLASRLRTEDAWRRHPEHERVPIERPIFVTGLPRTGTTALHRLLSADPRHQGLELWLTAAPQPRPDRESWRANPDYQRVRREIDARYAGAPALKGMHFMAPEVVEECWRLERQSMRSVAFASVAHLPGYLDWLAGQDLTPVYQRHRRILRLIGMRTPRRRWVLKNPGHLFGIDALLAVYPDALIVQTHRDPSTVIASVSSLTAKAAEGNSTVFHGDVVGRDNLELWARGAERLLAARERHDPARFADVRYEDLVGDPIGTVERVYHHFGLTLDDAARAAIAETHAASTTGDGKPAHRYALSDFGLSEAQVGDRFAAYIDACPVSTGR
ncbi:MAG: sulfotransferase [Actinophytocola sp.]|nr:sulfotransferase [Actinophytocola sp.]